MKEFHIFKCLCDIYNGSLFLSFRAFLPSLRVIKTSQERDETTKKVSVKREIKVVSIWLDIKLNLINSLRL